jgi:hypothetical protein
MALSAKLFPMMWEHTMIWEHSGSLANRLRFPICSPVPTYFRSTPICAGTWRFLETLWELGI